MNPHCKQESLEQLLAKVSNSPRRREGVTAALNMIKKHVETSTG